MKLIRKKTLEHLLEGLEHDKAKINLLLFSTLEGNELTVDHECERTSFLDSRFPTRHNTLVVLFYQHGKSLFMVETSWPEHDYVYKTNIHYQIAVKDCRGPWPG